MLVDALVKLEASKPVPSFEEYKILKQRQKRTFRECEMWQFPSKKDE
jgi:hypothetical protein